MNNRERAAVSRFLSQATLGFDNRLLDHVTEIGIAAWLDEQLNSRVDEGTFQRLTEEIWHHFRKKLVTEHGEAAINGDGNNPALPYKWYFHMGWWHHTLTSREHLLRQRVALALSELLVISDNSALELDGIGMASYYDLLYRHAFGKYTDLLYDVSLHPCMGIYLTHMNNRKAVPAQNIHPDENYAREIMQLFTIGLYELNPDGTRKKAGNDDIPTYDNRDISGLARVFTGLKASSYEYEWVTSFWDNSYNGYPVDFGDGIDKTYKTIPFVNMTSPMAGDEKYHDRGAKSLLKGRIKLPGNQNVSDEIRQTVNGLVAHPNTAPFVATHLIRQLVSSNPSPDYVAAVARSFGSEGDLKAAVETTLLYPQNNRIMKKGDGSGGNRKEPEAQKMKAPILRATQLLRGFNVNNRSKRLWLIGDDLQEVLQQHPLSAPTVFNFYKPDFVPHGPLEKAGLTAPEFELHTSATSIGYVNLMYYWFFGDYLPAVSTEINRTPQINNVAELDPEILQQNSEDRLFFDFIEELEMAADPALHDQLIERLSVHLTGRQNLPIKDDIKEAFNSYSDQPLWVVQTICFLLSVSSYFVIQEA